VKSDGPANSGGERTIGTAQVIAFTMLERRNGPFVAGAGSKPLFDGGV
jgi:hypothetical protein